MSHDAKQVRRAVLYGTCNVQVPPPAPNEVRGGEEKPACFREGLEDPADVSAMRNRRGVPNL